MKLEVGMLPVLLLLTLTICSPVTLNGETIESAPPVSAIAHTPPIASSAQANPVLQSTVSRLVLLDLLLTHHTNVKLQIADGIKKRDSILAYMANHGKVVKSTIVDPKVTLARSAEITNNKAGSDSKLASTGDEPKILLANLAAIASSPQAVRYNKPESNRKIELFHLGQSISRLTAVAKALEVRMTMVVGKTGQRNQLFEPLILPESPRLVTRMGVVGTRHVFPTIVRIPI